LKIIQRTLARTILQKQNQSSSHGRMARGGHGLPKVSLGPVMPDPSTPCGRPTPETALQQFLGWPTRKAGGLQPSSTPSDTSCRTPKALIGTLTLVKLPSMLVVTKLVLPVSSASNNAILAQEKPLDPLSISDLSNGALRRHLRWKCHWSRGGGHVFRWCRFFPELHNKLSLSKFWLLSDQTNNTFKYIFSLIECNLKLLKSCFSNLTRLL
jgi:hypothetical protein